jgi:4-hydroxybenzoate polyprenyltransferase
LMFIGLCLSGSAAAIIADIRAAQEDQRYLRKNFGPFSLGSLSTFAGFIAVPFLMFLAMRIGLELSFNASLMILGYFLVHVVYTFLFKAQPILDVIVLASLFTWRILSGTVATGISSSFWILAFSLFFFLSVVLVEKHVEIINLARDFEKLPQRSYRLSDKGFVSTLGMTTGMVSVLILIIYLNQDQTVAIYGNSYLLWICPLVIFFWISRVWLLSHRNEIPLDIISFAVKDPTSYLVLLVLLESLILSKVFL